MRTYVLDTSVLLSDPRAVLRFDEHAVVLPVIVITELEGKRNHPELGYFARSALRLLDALRRKHGRLDRPVPLNDAGGTLRVELGGADDGVLPAGMRLGDNDTRILSAAVSLAERGDDVVIISKDLPMRIKAASVGLAAEEYRAQLAVDSGYTGMTELSVSAAEMNGLWEDERLEPADLVDAAIAEDPAFTTPAWNRLLRLGAFRQVREMESIAADPRARFEKETRENPTWSHREVRASVEASAGVDLGFIAVGCVGPPTPWEEVIDNLAVPTLIVTGTDRVVLRGEYLTNITRRANPRISTAVVVGAPHCVRRTRPERFHAVTDPWLRLHIPAPSPSPPPSPKPAEMARETGGSCT